MKNNSIPLLLPLLFTLLGWLAAAAQPTYKEFKNTKGEVMYGYDDGLIVPKKDVVESERLRIAATEKRWSEPAAAMKYAEEAILLNPKNYRAWSRRGTLKDAKGDNEGAILDYSKAIELNPKYDTAWTNRGGAKADKGEYNSAISDCNEAIRLNGDNPSAWSNRGYAKEQKGQLEEAIKDYKKAIEIYPNYETAKSNLRSAEAALAALRPKRPPTVHLLSVGIGVYQQDFMFNHLDFAVPGAFLVKGVYERRNLVQRGTPLNGPSATKTNILSELEKLTDPSKVQDDDLVIFFYSGHGTMSGGKIGICPWNYQSAADIIEDKAITAILDRCPARHKVCFIEACKNENAADVMDAGELRRFNEGRRSLAAGTVFLTSTEAGQKSWGNAEGGYFTRALLEGFDDGKADTNNDRNVTAQELFDYVQKRVKELTNGKQVPQINSGYPKDLVIMRLGNN